MEKPCPYCKGVAVKNGMQSNRQRYRCKHCKKHFQDAYTYKSYYPNTDRWIANLTLESCGIRGTGRLLNISPKTVLGRITNIAGKIPKPVVKMFRAYEVDEMRTFVRKKKKKRWLTYAMDSETREVVDFRVGGRGKKSLGQVCDTLLHSGAKRISTDGYNVYRCLIPESIHRVGKRGTNHIERNNLSIRNGIKRLSRKTIAFSKSLKMLESVMRIYFWFKDTDIANQYDVSFKMVETGCA